MWRKKLNDGAMRPSAQGEKGRQPAGGASAGDGARRRSPATMPTSQSLARLSASAEDGWGCWSRILATGAKLKLADQGGQTFAVTHSCRKARIPGYR